MDARAYLHKQGWRGDGHSLDRFNRGIKKPLLVSKKVDVLGVGLNKHAAVSDQWWLRAFDQGLKSLGTGVETTLTQVRKHGVNRGGLYARFVRGEGFAGTYGTTLLPMQSGSDGQINDEMPQRSAASSKEKSAVGMEHEGKRPVEEMEFVHESRPDEQSLQRGKKVPGKHVKKGVCNVECAVSSHIVTNDHGSQTAPDNSEADRRRKARKARKMRKAQDRLEKHAQRVVKSKKKRKDG